MTDPHLDGEDERDLEGSAQGDALSPLKRATVRLPRGRMQLYAIAAQHAVFIAVPILYTAEIIVVSLSGHVFAYDFHYYYWPVGARILHGLPAYVSPGSAIPAFVYPAASALFFVPLALLPNGLADALFTGLSVAALILSLRLLRVRDWRLYGLALLWPPVTVAWQNGNVTLLLVLGCAAVWRYRDRPIIVGLLLALLVSLKPLVWPLAIWLVATRRLLGLGYAVMFGLTINLVAWFVLGFGEFPRYVRLLSAFTKEQESRGYSLTALAMRTGVGREIALVLAMSIATVMAIACVRAGRRGGQSAALALSTGVTLAAAPIVWTHYFALLIVPLAVARPRFGPLWLVPLPMLFCPETPPGLWTHLIALCVGVSIIAFVVRKPMPNVSPVA